MALNIGSNIKRLRTEKGVTQEQLAERLSITYQSVSKWENNVTSPDLYLIPAIADYFDVSIDELFQPNMQGYKNKAARLFALHEHRRTKQNFDRADAEFEKLIAEGNADAEDHWNYGMLNQFRAQRLNQKAEDSLNKAIELGEGQKLSFRSDVTVGEAAQAQLNYLLESLGRGPDHAAADPEKALAIAKERLLQSPGDAGLLVKCGTLCKKLEHFGEAEAYFKKAVEANPDGGGSYYHMAFMYTEMKEYEKAIWAWEQVIALIGRLGLAVEKKEMDMEWPRREIEKLRALMEEG